MNKTISHWISVIKSLHRMFVLMVHVGADTDSWVPAKGVKIYV